MVVKEIDITKLKPFNWKWIVGFIIAMIVALLAYGLAQFAVGRIKAFAPTQRVEEATI